MFRSITEFVQFFWMFESQYHQRLSWEDASEARVSRARAEQLAAAQLQAMLDANPSGQLGDARLNDAHNLERSGLL
jgi:3-methyladenine DNA glycosylase Tag